MKVYKIKLCNADSKYSNVLLSLQRRFSQACNFVVEIARQNNCFGRVPLHHLAYRLTRARFPELGSQLVSNAIFAVSKKNKTSPSAGNKPAFDELSPVFFDKHTLSIKDSRLSLLTLEGRLKFNLKISDDFVGIFQSSSLKEIRLTSENGTHYLNFIFNYLSLETETILSDQNT